MKIEFNNGTAFIRWCDQTLAVMEDEYGVHIGTGKSGDWVEKAGLLRGVNKKTYVEVLESLYRATKL